MFNDIQFLDSLAKEYDKTVNRFVINNKKIFYLLEKRGIGNMINISVLPLSLYMPINNLSKEEIYEFIIYLKSQYKGIITIDINPIDKQLIIYDEVFNNNNFIKYSSYTHMIKLEDNYNAIYKRFNPTRRNEINKITQEDIYIKISDDIDDFKNYYKIYCDSTKRWGLSKPPHSEIFILNLHKVKNLKLYTCYKGDELLSGMLVFVDIKNNNAFYWHGATLVRDKYKKYYSVVKLMNFVLQDMNNKKIKYFDMGSSNKLLGVEKFKESFGANKIPIYSYKYENNLYIIIRKIYRLLNNIKNSILNFILPQ